MANNNTKTRLRIAHKEYGKTSKKSGGSVVTSFEIPHKIAGARGSSYGTRTQTIGISSRATVRKSRKPKVAFSAESMGR